MRKVARTARAGCSRSCSASARQPRLSAPPCSARAGVPLHSLEAACLSAPPPLAASRSSCPLCAVRACVRTCAHRLCGRAYMRDASVRACCICAFVRGDVYYSASSSPLCALLAAHFVFALPCLPFFSSLLHVYPLLFPALPRLYPTYASPLAASPPLPPRTHTRPSLAAPSGGGEGLTPWTPNRLRRRRWRTRR